MLLDGKVALVTGASRGIGRAIAIRLASEGAKVAINFAGNQKAAEEVKGEIEKNGGEAILVKANVADSAAVDEMFAKVIEAFGTLDILVNNAGITRDGLLIRMKDEDFDAVIDTNLKGVLPREGTQSGEDRDEKRSGRIVNMSSVVGLMGNAGQTNYAAAKAGVLGFSKSAAKGSRARRHGQHGRTGLHRHGYDGCPLGQGQGRDGPGDPDAQDGTSGRRRQCRTFPRIGLFILYHGSGRQCRRRHGYVI